MCITRKGIQENIENFDILKFYDTCGTGDEESFDLYKAAIATILAQKKKTPCRRRLPQKKKTTIFQ
jgi:hypothetical protein